MFNRFTAAVLAGFCMAELGCQSAMQCGDGCGRGCSLAFAKYDCSCDGAGGECCGASSAGSCGSGVDGCCGERPRVCPILDKLCGCHGCGELYWNEWHNDPPGCEPCDCLGNYAGPGAAGCYRAPYRRHDALALGQPWTPPALELADGGEIAR